MKPRLYDRNLTMLTVLTSASKVGYSHVYNDLYTASFELPIESPENENCQSFNIVDIFDDDQSKGKFRLLNEPSADLTGESGFIKYECEHVVATLMNEVVDGYLEAGGTGVNTATVIQTLLNLQSTQKWVLHECDFTYQFQYSWENTNVLDALFSIPKCFADSYHWVYDTSVFPWRISLKAVSTARGCEIRRKRNMREIQRSKNSSALCTRLYCRGSGEGVNQLGISGVNATGQPYIDSDTVATYGILASHFIDLTATSEATLLAKGQAILTEIKHPRYTYTAKALDLNRITGDSWDAFSEGKYVRIVDDSLSLDLDTMIIKISKSDVDGNPLDIDIVICNKASDVSTSIEDLSRRAAITAQYSQGATNLYAQQYADNADAAHPAKMRVYIPHNCAKINMILLSWKYENFRAYQTGAVYDESKNQTTSDGGSQTPTSSTGGGQSPTTADGGGAALTTADGGAHTPTSGGGGGAAISSSTDYGDLTGEAGVDGFLFTVSCGKNAGVNTGNPSPGDTSATGILITNGSGELASGGKSLTTDSTGAVATTGPTDNDTALGGTGATGGIGAVTNTGGSGALATDAAGTGATGAAGDGATGGASDATTDSQSDSSTGYAGTGATGSNGGHSHTVTGSSTTYTGAHTHTGPSHSHSFAHTHVMAHTHAGPSHSHSGPSHTHGLASHLHTVGTHTHSGPSHSHGIGTHSHTGGAHTHTVASHTHTIPDHNHTLAAHFHAMPHLHFIAGHNHTITIEGTPTHSHQLGNHYHTVTMLDHVHTVQIQPHSHTVTVAPHKHSVTVAAHQHTVTVAAHNHTVTIPSHTHAPVYGIYEGGIAASATLKVDGTTVPTGSVQNDEMDLVPFLSKDSNGKIIRGIWHEIQIIPNLLTRIEANLFVQTFVTSYSGGNY